MRSMPSLTMSVGISTLRLFCGSLTSVNSAFIVESTQHISVVSAKGGSRTPKALRPPAPKAGASASSATFALRRRRVFRRPRPYATRRGCQQIRAERAEPVELLSVPRGPVHENEHADADGVCEKRDGEERRSRAGPHRVPKRGERHEPQHDVGQIAQAELLHDPRSVLPRSVLPRQEQAIGGSAAAERFAEMRYARRNLVLAVERDGGGRPAERHAMQPRRDQLQHERRLLAQVFVEQGAKEPR